MKCELAALLGIIIALAALPGCGNQDRPPSTPVFLGLPDSARKDTTTMVKILSDAPTGKFLTYLVEWGDGGVETTATYVAGDSAEQWHTWHTVGAFSYRAMAYYTFDTTKYSDWSAGETVTVYP